MENEGTEEFKRRQNIQKSIIVIMLFMFVIIGVIYLNQQKIEKKNMEFDHVWAVVEWTDENNITIEPMNTTTQIHAKVIGINEGIEVEYNQTNLCSDNITFDLTKMLEDNMEIWVEIENIGYGIKERQILIKRR